MVSRKFVISTIHHRHKISEFINIISVLHESSYLSKSAALFSSEGKYSRLPHVVRFYGMLKILAEYDRDITSAKFKDISRKLPASLPDISAATRELWWMNQE
jgi:hypothetical protein